MRGEERSQESVFSYVMLEDRVPADHPLRPMRKMVDRALQGLSQRLAGLYSSTGRPSIPPEQLLRALVIQILYSVRSERMLMEQMDYNLLFRWFVGLKMDDPVWDATVFSKNRDRLLEGDVAAEFFAQVVAQAGEAGLMSEEHFTVDGTLIEAWASQKSFQKKDEDGDSGDGENFHGGKRTNETHESKTDPEARLYRKGRGKESKLSYMGHVLMENRNGLVADARVTLATGKAEREAGLEMVGELRGGHRGTLGADKGYAARDFVEGLREMGMTPHVAMRADGHGGLDGRTTRHASYQVSQVRRKLVETIFGWLKTVGLMRKTRHRGRDRVSWMFTFAAATFNLVRMRTLLTPT